MKHATFTTAPRRNPPTPGRDWTLDECRAVAGHAHPTQPSNALYSRTPEELTDALFAIAGKLVTKVGQFDADEAEYRANRDTANAHLDAHRDAALKKLGYL